MTAKRAPRPRTREGVLVETIVPGAITLGSLDRPSVRVSVTVSRLQAAGRIGLREVQAAAWLRSHIESVECYGARAVDYSADKVDGTRAAHPLTTNLWAVVDAMETLREVEEAIGLSDYRLARAIVYEDRTVMDLQPTNRAARDGLIDRLVRALGVVADRWCQHLNPNRRTAP